MITHVQNCKIKAATAGVCVLLAAGCVGGIGLSRLDAGHHVPGDPDAVSSYAFNQDEHLKIIANRPKIEDAEAFAAELLSMVQHDGFQTITFCFDDRGYPTSLDMTVYLWEDSDEPEMTISYTPEDYSAGYNLIEHPEKFILEIK